MNLLSWIGICLARDIPKTMPNLRSISIWGSGEGRGLTLTKSLLFLKRYAKYFA